MCVHACVFVSVCACTCIYDGYKTELRYSIVTYISQVNITSSESITSLQKCIMTFHMYGNSAS